MANDVLMSTLALEPLLGVMQEEDKSELERVLDTFDSPADYLAHMQNATIYAGLSGDEPNQVYEYTDSINEELYGTSSHETALANNKKASETARITLIEKLKNFGLKDFLSKLPFSPFHEYEKKEAAYGKIELKDIEWGPTPITKTGRERTEKVRKRSQEKIEKYAEMIRRGQTIPATIFDGVTMLPAYMIEFYYGGQLAKAIGLPIKGIKGAFAASTVRTAIQPHRVASSIIDQQTKGESSATALFKAYGDVYIENISEAAGEGFVPLIKKLPLGSKLVGALTRIGKKLNIPKSKVIERIAQKGGWNGLVSEWGEERLATELQAIFNVNDFGAGPDSSIPDRMAAGFLADMTINNQLAEVGVLSFPFAAKMLASKIVGPEPIEIEEVEIPPTKPIPTPEIKPTEPTITPEVKPKVKKPEIIERLIVPERETLKDMGISGKEIITMSPKEARKRLHKKVPVEEFSPDIVTKEIEGKQPELTEESKNAANAIEHYWREYDEREFEIDVRTKKNQEQIAHALKKEIYLPKTDIETKDMSLAMMLYIDLKEHPEGHKFAEEFEGHNREVYETSQNLPSEIRKVADRIIEQNRKAGELAVEQGVIKEARENYIAHLWKRTPQYESFFARFRQKTARARRRTMEGGIAEGLSRGMELRIKDVTLASQIAQSQVNQTYVGKKLLQMGKEWGLLSHQQEMPDWIKVDHPGFTTWRYRGTVGLGEPGKIKKGDWVKAEDRRNLGKVISIEDNTATVHFVDRQTGKETDVELPVESLKIVRPRGAAFYITEEGAVMERVPVYAEPVIGKKLNNIFAPSVIYKIPGAKTITRYNAIIKSTILYTSLFHHQAFLRSYAFGSRGINPVDAYKKGRQAIMNMEPEVRLLVRNGMTLGRIQDYDPYMLEGENTIWGKVFALTEPTEKVNEWLQNLRRKQERFLFNKLGPYLKAQAGLLELKVGLERNRSAIESGEMTADDVAKSVAVLVNNDFGGLHLGRMGRNNTMQHLMRLMLLAPDWTESNVRSMIDAFRKGETGYMHRMFWGRIAIKGMGATVLFNLLLSAFDDEDFVERYKKAWKEGRLRWLDIDITPIYKAMGGKTDSRKYFSLIGHFRDPVKFVVRPGVSLKHKGSVVSRIIYDFATGQDWAGREFTTIGELTGLSENGKLSGRLVKWGRGKAQVLEPNQLPSWFIYEARQSMPIPIQNIAAFLSGEMEAFDSITKSLGMMVTTTYPKKRKKRRGGF